VVLLAPLAGTGRGAAAHAAMAERPAILRTLRAADAAALAAIAAALWAAPAQAATVFAVPATDPSADGALVAFQQPGVGGVLARVGEGGFRRPAPGGHPAVGGGKLAWIGSGTVEGRAQADPADVVTLPAAADAAAVSGGWVAWRAADRGRDALFAAALPPAAPGVRRVARAGSGSTLGRPALTGDRLLFHVAGATRGRIDQIRLASGSRGTLRSAPRTLLLNPSSDGRRLLYVRSTFERQQLRIGLLRTRPLRRDRSLYGTVPTGRRDAGHEPGEEHQAHGHPKELSPRPPRNVSLTLWSTALGPDSAFVTRLRQNAGRPLTATLLRVPR
jgi:hypothetical protein